MNLLVFIKNKLGLSRRNIFDLLKSGKISIYINGKLIDDFTYDLKRGDKIEIIYQGKEYTWTFNENTRTRLIVFYKPKGVTVSKSDEFNKTIYDILPQNYKKYFYVGRLDKNSEGLLLLTNNGNLANKLMHPSFGKIKVYEVGIWGKLSFGCKKKLLKGFTVDGEFLKAKSVNVISSQPKKQLLEIILTYGKNRQIRKMLETCGLRIFLLKRVQFGKYKLGKLTPGKRYEVKKI